MFRFGLGLGALDPAWVLAASCVHHPLSSFPLMTPLWIPVDAPGPEKRHVIFLHDTFSTDSRFFNSRRVRAHSQQPSPGIYPATGVLGKSRSAFVWACGLGATRTFEGDLRYGRPAILSLSGQVEMDHSDGERLVLPCPELNTSLQITCS